MVQRDREVRNAARREYLHQQSSKDKRKAKLQRRMDTKKAERDDKTGELKRQRLAVNVPRTIENTREWIGGAVKEDDGGQAESASDDSQGGEEDNDDGDDDGSDDDDDAVDIFGEEDDIAETSQQGAKRSLSDHARGKAKATSQDNDDGAADEGDARTRPVRIKAGADPENGDDFVLDMAGLETLFPESFNNADPTIQKPILLTTFPRPHNRTYLFLQEFASLLGGKKHAHFFPRKHARFELSKVCRWAAKRDYGAIVVVGEDQHDEPATMTISMLPDGPCAHFRLTSVALHRQISGSANPTSHIPELVLSNFSTPLGLSTGRLLQSLFPPLPQIVGRQVVAVHNQRDYIFFRRFRYMFAIRETEASRKAARDQGRDEDLRTRMQEIGPRFTLKLRWIKKGALGEEGSRRIGNEGLFVSQQAGAEDDAATVGGAQAAELTLSEQTAEAEALKEMLKQDANLPAQLAVSASAKAGASAPATVNPDMPVPTSTETAQVPVSKEPFHREHKPRTHNTEGRIIIPTFELPTSIPKEELPHHRKLKKGASVLDSLAVHVGLGRGGTKRKAMEWEWNPRMNVSRRKFAM